MRVTSDGLDREDSSMAKSDTSEGSYSDIEDEDVAIALGLLVEIVGDSGRGGLIDDMGYVEASDRTGVLGGSTLRVVEVCKDGDDGLGDDGSEVGSSSRASLGLAMVPGLRVCLSAVGDDFEREVLHVGLDFSIVELAADEVLRVEDGVDEVHRDLVFSRRHRRDARCRRTRHRKEWCGYPGRWR